MMQRLCRPLARRLDSLDDRRWLITIVLTVGFGLLLFYVLLVTPVERFQQSAQRDLDIKNAQLAKLNSTSTKLEIEIGQLQREIDAAVNDAGLDADGDLAEQVDEMRNQITALIEAGGVENAMLALDTLLTEAKGLKVGSLKLTGTETVVEENNNAPAVYRHDIEVVAQGGYFDVVSYLNALDDISGSTHIANVSYKVKEWPMAEVVVKISAFSTSEEWIDVES